MEVNSDVLGSELVPVPAGRYCHGCGNLRVIRALLRESGEAFASTHPAESQEPRLRLGFLHSLAPGLGGNSRTEVNLINPLRFRLRDASIYMNLLLLLQKILQMYFRLQRHLETL